ncbi:MAG: Asp-tRNA(Asn)/Glu-tRNA(Gln) amidotransferase subunit GatC [Helicobacter sp.]|uniref:Asp-tRNA(Asn)/Glu-tRNA(Gln) amidotransferase subunit GatC n=1 Tax=Helicobacter sp. 10-6591 TaxID=2004998 RepID=UPI000DCDEBD6|nr:Asp-tRNA(Asn)/Glu-tRNA(Gln) amidotransferase subunit GatC [Helicobacter sp. 10-6591]MCI6218228.1 Asp-tRNA(Asn)/Glu-tRNA(Gln) amidotransferase subunit GatC [Helicobacter sp.]RAX56148.1 Asp-tRNA(Asn)/Glu-tRNA(Gln) amidotransferase GatCAB subunit C [Helicobacter sp. 10-6591]
MLIDDTLLARLQKLGMIEIPSEKKEQIKAQLSEILEFVQNLESLSTTSLPSPTTTLKTPLREDEVIYNGIGRDILENAPLKEDGFFIVPKIIE